MTRLVGIALGSLLVLVASGAVATPPGPGQPFDCSGGGTTSCTADDTGCVPQTKDTPAGQVATLKCGDGIAKAFSKAISSVIKCHKAMADSVFKGTNVDDELC